jgi:hypothetical protein
VVLLAAVVPCGAEAAARRGAGTWDGIRIFMQQGPHVVVADVVAVVLWLLLLVVRPLEVGQILQKII